MIKENIPFRDIEDLFDEKLYGSTRILVKIYLKRNPSDIEGWLLLSRTDNMLDYYDESLESIRRAYQINPNHKVAKDQYEITEDSIKKLNFKGNIFDIDPKDENTAYQNLIKYREKWKNKRRIQKKWLNEKAIRIYDIIYIAITLPLFYYTYDGRFIITVIMFIFLVLIFHATMKRLLKDPIYNTLGGLFFAFILHISFILRQIQFLLGQ